jgi:uncharacterized protein YecT (DUF1311 family)
MSSRRACLLLLAGLAAAGCGGSSSGGAPPLATNTSAPAASSPAPTTSSPASASTPRTAPPKVTEPFTPLPCDANTTVGMEGCAERKIVRADADVDQLVQLIWDNSTPDGKSHLADAQTAWQAYRKAACVSESDKYAGGTLAPVVDAQCTVRLTRVRAAELRRQLRLLTAE